MLKSLLGHVRYLFLCLTLMFQRGSGPVVLGFLVNKREALFLPTVRKGAKIVRVNFLRGAPGLDGTQAKAKLRFLLKLLPDDVTIVVWGYRDRINLGFHVEELISDVIRIEAGLVPGKPDGRNMTAFLRSRKGIYFDGRSASELEEQLNGLTSADTTAPRENLIESLVKTGVTKFKAERSEFKFADNPVLIVGQVRGDQALTYTDTACETNTDLARLVLGGGTFNSSHSFYYKAHPKNKQNEAEIRSLRESYPQLTILPTSLSIIDLLDQKPTVATITSGVGLEAALRGCQVHCYGVSFYSNWGFTVDHVPCARRTARLRAVDVAAAIMIDQTTYVDPATGAEIHMRDVYGTA